VLTHSRQWHDHWRDHAALEVEHARECAPSLKALPSSDQRPWKFTSTQPHLKDTNGSWKQEEFFQPL